LITTKELQAALIESGLEEGDTVLLQSDLLRIGPIDADGGRGDLLSFYFDTIKAVLGDEGTLCVLTSFEKYAREGVPYDRRQSPSQSGVLSQYVLDQQGSVRSIHPIVSIAALGPQAEEICGGAHFEGFGWDSPWGRLHRRNAKLVSLGYGAVPDGMTFLHYIELLFGVPYQYTKLYDFPVLDDGKVIEGTFTLSVRYLNYEIENDQTALKQELLNRKLATERPIGRSVVYTTDCHSVEQVAGEMFRKDRYMMLKRPPAFRRGEIPFDGQVGQASQDKDT
jgi:aminoglycoside 3-N-acetyltransferase